MRVLTVTHFFASHGGGIERVAERLNDELVNLGHEVTWLATDGSPPEPDSKVKTQSIRAWHWVERRLGIPFPVPFNGQSGVISKAVAQSDAVMMHDCLYLSNILVFLAAWRDRKPVIVIQHIGEVPYRNTLLRLVMKAANRFFARPILARANQVVFISELTAEHFSNVAFASPPVVAFNGVDSDVFRLRADKRRSLAFETKTKLAIFVGRFVEKKGLDVIRRLAEECADVTFMLAGQGPIDPGGWKLPNVRVLGHMTAQGLADLYRAGDVLILPSTGEGFPLVIQEALACGLPVICGMDTALADRDATPFMAGAAVDPANIEITVANFRQELDRRLAAKEPAEKRKERSRFATERYSWAKVGRIYDGLLRGLVA